MINGSEITASNLIIELKYNGVEIGADEVQKIFAQVSRGQQTVSLETFFDLFISNYGNERLAIAKNAFNKFDYMSNGKISLFFLKELFNSKTNVAVT